MDKNNRARPIVTKESLGNYDAVYLERVNTDGSTTVECIMTPVKS